MHNTHDMFIYLASASPRRRELLEQIGMPYHLLSVDVNEQALPGEAPEVYVLRLALEKARAGLELLATDDQRPVLGADTAVVVDERVLGKPRDQNDAEAMLDLLSAREHQVMSAIAMVNHTQEHSRLSVSRVRFRDTSAQERAEYWASGEPADKAGGYAIQGRGAVFVERLEGSYSGVMGLPLYETAELLRVFAIDPLMEKGHE